MAVLHQPLGDRSGRVEALDRAAFDPNCSSATTTYNAATNCWVTVVPLGYTGNVFLTGVNYSVPSGFPTKLTPVTWNGSFRGDNSDCNARWQWSAAAYTQCSSSLNSLGIKAVDSSTLCSYKNSDKAGTPENYKGYVTGGACGTGGTNYTGTYCSPVAPSVGTNCWLDNSVNSGTWGNNNGWAERPGFFVARSHPASRSKMALRSGPARASAAGRSSGRMRPVSSKAAACAGSSRGESGAGRGTAGGTDPGPASSASRFHPPGSVT